MACMSLLLLFCMLLTAGTVCGQQQQYQKQKARFDGIAAPRNSGGPYHESIRADAIKALRSSTPKAWDAAQSEHPQWTVVGPLTTAGRIRCVVVHPTDPSIVYIGAAAGGVWKSTDSGAQWTATMDDANGIAMGALAMDPRNPNVILAGTGEPVRRINSSFLGCGLLRSTNAGASWQPAGLGTVGAFSRIIIHPSQPQRIMAAGMNTNAGVWRSNNDGTTWQRIFDGQIYDMCTNPSNADEYFITLPDSGIFFTANGGSTWERRMSGIDGAIGRTSIHQAPSSPNIVYALVERNARGSIWKSTDKGLTWRALYEATSACFFTGTCREDESQGFYDNYITVHPTNPNVVLAGGIDIWRCSDGENFDNITRGYERGRPMGPVHVDQHAAAFAPSNPAIVYAANDGGMVRSVDLGSTWQVVNTGLAVTQFYSFDVDPLVRDRMAGGTQDNGTLAALRSTIDWDSVYAGDGMVTVIDHTEPAVIFGNLPYGAIYRVNTETGDIRFVMVGIDNAERTLWVAPLVMDPKNNSVLWHGRRRVYKTTDRADQWQPMSPYVAGSLSAIAVATSNGNVVAAGSDRGEVIITTDGGTQWKSVDDGLLPSRWIGSIAFDPKTASTLWVGLQGYGDAQVWRSTDGGVTWHSRSHGFPNVPVNKILHHPLQNDVLYAATDVGVFATTDAGATWFPYGKGLPRSPAVDIKINLTLGYLRVATLGRSIWECAIAVDPPSDPVVTVPTGGEALVGLRTTTVAWNGVLPPVSVEYSVNDGATWNAIDSNVNAYATQWRVSHWPTATARIRVTSLASPASVAVSRPFTIATATPGTVLASRSTWWRPNGLAFDGKHTLWTSSFSRGQLFKLDANSLALLGSVRLPPEAGDSLFTDIAYDSTTGHIYIHRLNALDGQGATIVVVDTNGTFVRSFASPATSYGVGLTLRGSHLIVGERDAPWRLFEADATTGAVTATRVNPVRGAFGPRALATRHNGLVAQAFTAFSPETGRLNDAVVDEISLIDATTAQRGRRISTHTRDNVVNVRGLAIDDSQQTLWVTDFNGQILRFAAWDVTVPPVTGVAEYSPITTLSVAPMPATSSTWIRFTPATPGLYTVTLFSVVGAEARSAQSFVGAPYQESAIRLMVDGLPSGQYTVVLEHGGRRLAAAPLTVIR